ncbi:MAG TPA: hypothetical protein VGI40_20665 [Pirellulaceae bacterium]
MRYRVGTLLIVWMLVPPVLRAEEFVPPTSNPRLRIRSVEIPDRKSDPLKISFEFASDGKTPVALSQSQFSVHISANDPLFRFIADPSFTATAPRVLIAMPEKPLLLSVSASVNRFKRDERWSDLPPGTYNLQVYVNSGKALEFDYQWLGQTYSDKYTLVIK